MRRLQKMWRKLVSPSAAPKTLFPPGHFYSPIVDVVELRSRQARVWPPEPEVLGIYAGMCASTLADAHARSGDEIALGAYLSSKPGVRPGPGGLCQFLCGPERHRSPGAHRCRQGRRPGR